MGYVQGHVGLDPVADELLAELVDVVRMKGLQRHNGLNGQGHAFLFHSLNGVFGHEKIVFDAAYPGIDGSLGVDYAFLRIIDMIRPIRPDQVARGVLENAPSEGLINFGIRLSGVDSLENDDSVEVFVAPTSEVPLRGTDGRIIPRSSVPIDPNPAWHNTFRGQIVDGVLTTEPADFTLGNVDLIIVFDRVLELRGARIRATFRELREGVIEVDSVLAGWWSTDNMIDTIGDIVLAIGANDGELLCSAQMWADGSSDGMSCDMTSMIFKTISVSGFLTDIEEAN